MNVSMHPALRQLLEYIGPILAGEIDFGALESSVAGYEWNHPFTNPIPGIIADAERIFPDAASRPSIVAFLSVLQVKQMANATGPGPL